MIRVFYAYRLDITTFSTPARFTVGHSKTRVLPYTFVRDVVLVGFVRECGIVTEIYYLCYERGGVINPLFKSRVPEALL